MTQRRRILNIAIPNTKHSHFDYVLPDEHSTPVECCQRVAVHFRNKPLIGVIVGTAATTQVPEKSLKHVDHVIDAAPILPKEIFKLCQWASEYYQTSLNEVIFTALPKHLRDGKALPAIKPTVVDRVLTDNLILNAEQENAINGIVFNHFSATLLHGITGSGKTEVYIRLIQQALSLNQQILVLVPEIGLTPQLFSRLQARIEVPIAVMHSGLNDTERVQAWQQSATGHARVLIGTRSAVFTPMPDLGLIIVDEEHDLSLKQQDGIRYHARDLALVRAKHRHIPIMLGSATPSLETLHNAAQKKYQCFTLNERATGSLPAACKLIDIRNQPLNEGLSDELIQAMRDHLEAGNQVMLFVNRRGYAPVLLCPKCAWISDCRACDAHMTLHSKPTYLQCHHCGLQQSLPKQCPTCQHTQLIPIGVGTERLEETIHNLFPTATCVRIDRDTTRRKNALANLLKRVTDGEVQIILGTQMVAKGHHFPNVTMVGILDVDYGFFSVDFRSAERLGQLLTQVSGRAGRESKPGYVYLQTQVPQHPHLLSLVKDGYTEFAKKLLEERRQAGFPPYRYLALLKVEAKTAKQAREILLKSRDQLKKLANNTLDILGPAPCVLEKKAGWFRYQLLLRSASRAALQSCLQRFQPEWESHRSSTTKIFIDIDPQELN